MTRAVGASIVKRNKFLDIACFPRDLTHLPDVCLDNSFDVSTGDYLIDITVSIYVNHCGSLSLPNEIHSSKCVFLNFLSP